jgi:hypothetical protein
VCQGINNGQHPVMENLQKSRMVRTKAEQLKEAEEVIN